MRSLCFWTLLISLWLFPLKAIAESTQVLNISEEEVVDAIKKEFVDRNFAEDENIDLEFFGGQTDFQIEGAKQAKILVDNLKVEENLGRFNCDLEIFADRKSYARATVLGKYYLMAEVWVPSENIAKGELITADMLKSKLLRMSKIKSSMVTDKEKLIAQEAKKSLKKGKLISHKDVGPKILIKRNDIVLAIYKTEKMQITAKAIAQQDAAYGDRIELQNMKTKKVLTGVVQDASTVVVE